MKNIIIKSISKFTEVITGGTPSTGKSEYWDGNIPWLNSGVLNDGDIKTPSKYITELGLKNSSARLMPKDTVLIALTGTTTGQVGYLSFEATANQSVTGILPSKEHHPRYLYYYLKSQREKIQGDAFGGAQPHINQKYIKDFKVPLPLLNDQICIANLLDQVESLIIKRKESITLLDELLKSTFLNMFDYRDIPKLLEKSPIQKLEEVSDVVSGITKGKQNLKDDLFEVPYMRVANVQDGHLNLKEIKSISATISDIEKYLLKVDDILLTEGGDADKLGRGTVWNGEVQKCIHQNHIFRVRIKDKNELHPIYLSHLIASQYGKKYFLKAAKQTTGIATINSKQLKSFPVIKPSIKLQQQFVEIVQQVEQTKTIFLESLEELENLFASLSQMAFKGELDLDRLKVDLEKTNTPSRVNTISNHQKENYNPISYLDKNSNSVFDEDFLQMLIQQSDDDITFESINKKLQKFSFQKQPSYEDVQTHIFSLIKKSYLEQLFDKQKNEILLRKKI